MSNRIIKTSGVWLDYHNFDKEQTMHVVEWLNAEGVDVFIDGDLKCSLYANELKMLTIGANCLGLLDIAEIKEESDKVFENTKEYKKNLKRFKEKVK